MLLSRFKIYSLKIENSHLFPVIASNEWLSIRKNYSRNLDRKFCLNLKNILTGNVYKTICGSVRLSQCSSFREPNKRNQPQALCLSVLFQTILFVEYHVQVVLSCFQRISLLQSVVAGGRTSTFLTSVPDLVKYHLNRNNSGRSRFLRETDNSTTDVKIKQQIYRSSK